MIRPAFAERRTRFLTVLIGVTVSFHVLVFVAYYRWRVSVPTGILGSDLRAFYTSWRMVGDGRAAHLYDLGLQIRTQSAIMGRAMSTDSLLAFVNPPYVSLAFSWLGLLGPRAAYAVFSGMQLACLGIACRIMLRGELSTWSRRAQVVFLGSGVLSAATLSAITLGTFTPTILLAMVGLGGEYRRSFSRPVNSAAVESAVSTSSTDATPNGLRTWRIAGWLCVLTIKPQLAVFVVVALVAGRQWKVLRRAAVLGAGTATATTLICGLRIWEHYVRFLAVYGRSNGKFGGDSHYMWNLRGALTRLHGLSTATADQLANMMFVATVIAFGLWVARASSGVLPGARPILFEQTAALASVLTVLFVPHCNRQDMLLLLPGIVAAYNLRRARGRESVFTTRTPNRMADRLPSGGDWFVVVACILSAVALTWDNDPNGYALHPLTLLATLTGALVIRAIRRSPLNGGADQPVT